MAQVLLAAGNSKAQAAFATLLDDMGCTPIVRAVSGKEALRVLQEESFSLVLIVTPLTDGSGARGGPAGDTDHCRRPLCMHARGLRRRVRPPAGERRVCVLDRHGTATV